MDDRIRQFFKELSVLLSKYGVEIRSSDEWQGYAECGEDIQIDFEFPFDVPYFDCSMGNYIDAKKIDRFVEIK